MTRRGKMPMWLNLGIPPAPVLDEALCDSSTAYLFDQNAHDFERPPAREHRHAQAREICNGSAGSPPCSVRIQCFAWALENDQCGVFGGQVITKRTLSRYRKTATRYVPIVVKETA